MLGKTLDIVVKSNITTFGKKYDLFILSLCFYVLVELSIEIILRIPEPILKILNLIDLGVCIIFLFDWFYFFIKSDQKGKYFKTRLIDLIASIPFAQILRPFRILRTIRLVRTLKLLRGIKGTKSVFGMFLKNPARSAITVYLTLTGIVYFYCSLGLYTYESGVNEGINRFGDVLWMSFTTLTSVGYGDIYPVTTPGRILAAILVITGMGLFGLVTAEIATIIIRVMKDQEE